MDHKEEVKQCRPATLVRSYSDRQVSDVAAPATNRLSAEDLYGSTGKYPDCDILKRHLAAEGRLEETVAIRIINEASHVFRSEPNLLEIIAPVTVCGDIHGQYYDLLTLLKPNIGGKLSETKYLFLGDYVDRGYFGVECILLLFSLKLTHPDKIFMLRGNHECRHLTAYFTFKQECLIKYSLEFYEACMLAFDALPLAAVVNHQFFCVHGGLSPELRSLSDVQRIDRFKEPDTHGLMCDLLWADPAEDFGNDNQRQHFTYNKNRSCSYFYTFKACCAFLERNKLLGVIRAHEVHQEGFKMYKSHESTTFPVLVSLFSAPNYIDEYNNKASVLLYDGKVFNIRLFNAVKHPYWLPNFVDVFTWSYPFMAEKVTEMLLTILSICSDEEINDDDVNPSRREVIRNKILAMGRIQSLYEKQRKRNVETALHGMVPGVTRKQLVAAKSFEEIKDLDRINEGMPEAPGATTSDEAAAIAADPFATPPVAAFSTQL